MYGIRGPPERPGLDYSELTGLLNKVKVVVPGGDANVALQCEPIEGAGESPCV